MKMKTSIRTAAYAALTTLSITAVTHAVAIYDSVGFETPASGFVPGSIDGQSGGSPSTLWGGSTLGTPPTATVQGAVFREGTQALELDRAGGDAFFGPLLPPTAITDPTGSQQLLDVRWSMTVDEPTSFDAEDNSAFFGASWRLRLDGATSTNRIVSFGVDTSLAEDGSGAGTGEVVFFFDNGVFGRFVDDMGDAVAVPLGTDQWFEFILRVDTSDPTNDSVTFLLGDGTGFEELTLDPSEVSSTDLLGGNVTSVDTGVVSTDNLFAPLSAEGTAYYDEFCLHIQAIPEPAGLAMFGLIATGLFRRRRA
ncbi:MAG: PEP-CTERM sorting domain-containing protein [Planctomycetota bacterium]